MSERKTDGYYTFTIKSELPQEIPVDFFELTLYDIKQLLSRIEFAHTGDQPQASWKVNTDGVYITASVNGLSEEELKGILWDAYAGFEANEYGKEENWPKSYDENTKQVVKRIANRVKKSVPMMVQVIEREPLRITPTKQAKRQSREKYIAWASIEGTLDVISVHGRPFFVLYEHGSSSRVRCTFPDNWTEKVVTLLGKRVTAEGLVYYKQSGEPYQLSKPISIELVPLPQSDVLALRGAIKGMTGNLSTYEYIRELREKDRID